MLAELDAAKRRTVYTIYAGSEVVEQLLRQRPGEARPMRCTLEEALAVKAGLEAKLGRKLVMLVEDEDGKRVLGTEEY